MNKIPLFLLLLAGITLAGCSADEKSYDYLEMGNQKWMSENLSNKVYSDGSQINYYGEDHAAWESDTEGAYAWYNNDNELGKVYGALYNWYAVSNAKGVCPVGWRMPTDEDWKELERFLGMSSEEIDQTGLRGPDGVGGKLKATQSGGDSHPFWLDPNSSASDDFGFSGLAAGEKNPNGAYNNIGLNGTYWTVTQDGNVELRAVYRNLGARHGGIYRLSAPKNFGFSVRCIKEE